MPHLNLPITKGGDMERITHWLAWSLIFLLVLFAGLNWSVLTAQTPLDLLVAKMEAPMGLILLGLTALFVALFFIATLYSRIAYLLEARNLSKELRTAQELARNAEASRLESLQQVILSEFRLLHERINTLEKAELPLVKLP
jgi:uncharacterized integral membrane protein